MRYEKIYVEVIVRFLSDGGMRPIELTWKDGSRYIIDKIKFIERAPAKVSALSTTRYTVVICGVEKYLYFEEFKERWFVEKRI